jgi:hypothetical protein
MKDVPGIDLEHVPMSPSIWALAGRMTVHYSGPGIVHSTDGSWSGIGVWYDALAKDRLTATPEIAAKAQELTAGKSDFFEKGEAIAESVKKTSKAIVAHEDTLSWGYGAEIAARIGEELFDWLDAPVRRVGAMDTFVAYQPVLEDAILPQAEDLYKAMEGMAGY